jgi:hypothetical protein
LYFLVQKDEASSSSSIPAVASDPAKVSSPVFRPPHASE